jgi:hypothetical protein
MASVSQSNISKEEFSRACDSYVIKLNTPPPPPPKPIKLTPVVTPPTTTNPPNNCPIRMVRGNIQFIWNSGKPFSLSNGKKDYISVDVYLAVCKSINQSPNFKLSPLGLIVKR